MPATGGIKGKGQSERPKPDPWRCVQASQVAANRSTGTHDQSGLMRWTGSGEQEQTRGHGDCYAQRSVGSRPMPSAPNLTNEQVHKEREREMKQAKQDRSAGPFCQKQERHPDAAETC